MKRPDHYFPVKKPASPPEGLTQEF
jgi:hypothetical protein